MIRALFRRLRRSRDGVTVIEFALLAPVLLTMLMGLLDLAHNMFTMQMLQGAVQQAARNSSIEGANIKTAALDGIVTTAVHAISPQATLQFDRSAYSSFTDVAQPEDFTDIDSNETCDNGEPFEDANGNGTWDADRGRSGHGGARDAVLYTVTITYPRFFPIARLIPGQTDSFTMSTRTVLRNQPFGAQDASAPAIGACT